MVPRAHGWQSPRDQTARGMGHDGLRPSRPPASPGHRTHGQRCSLHRSSVVHDRPLSGLKSRFVRARRRRDAFTADRMLHRHLHRRQHRSRPSKSGLGRCVHHRFKRTMDALGDRRPARPTPSRRRPCWQDHVANRTGPHRLGRMPLHRSSRRERGAHRFPAHRRPTSRWQRRYRCLVRLQASQGHDRQGKQRISGPTSLC